MRSVIFVTIIGLIWALSEFRSPGYEASFVAAVGDKPPGRDFVGIYDPPDFATYRFVLTSPHFWSRFVAPHMPSSARCSIVRGGMTVRRGEIEVIGDALTFEFRLCFSVGTEADFEAVYRAFDDYMSGFRRPSVLSIKKPNPEGCVARSRNTTLVERARK